MEFLWLLTRSLAKKHEYYQAMAYVFVQRERDLS